MPKKLDVSNDALSLLENKIDPLTGFLHAKVVMCRSGVQPYLGRELGLTGDDTLKTFNVLRHPDDVINEDSLKTYKNLVVTDEHPNEGWVDLDNIKQLQKGQLSETTIDESQDEVHLIGDVTITDELTIEKVIDGKVEVSLGYARKLIAEDGMYNNTPYQYKYTDIIANHLSIVDKGRCGGSCKIVNDTKHDIILDEDLNNEEGVLMKIKINGKEFDVSDEVGEAIMAERKAADEEMVEKEDEVKTANDKLDAKIDRLKEQLKVSNDAKPDDAAISKMVGERAKLFSFASAIVGDSITCDCDAKTIKKAVVEKHFGKSLDGKSDDYIDVRFEMVEEDMVAQDKSIQTLAGDLEKNKQIKTSNDAIAKDARDAYIKRKGL